MIKERMTLMGVVEALEQRQLVLPLFQRPFVWSEDQVCDLFDSLWQGYPIGQLLLLEQAPPDLEQRLQCCFFPARAGSQQESLRQRRSDARIFEKLKAASHLVLDGQQRLFAFLIGIAGSYMRPAGPGHYESAQLYFDLYPLIELFCGSNLSHGAVSQAAGEDPVLQKVLGSLGLEHHQFRFYSVQQLADYQGEIQAEARGEGMQALLDCDLGRLQLPLSLVRSWGRDRRTAKSEIRRYLRGFAALPRPLLDELEDLFDNLHHHLWIRELVSNTTVSPRSGYELLEIFSRLNQGSSFRASDLHYAVRIVFPHAAQVGKHKFSRFLEGSETGARGEQSRETGCAAGQREPQDQGGPDPVQMEQSGFGREHYTAEEWAELSARNPRSDRYPSEELSGVLDGQNSEELEENYERLLQTADELRLGLDFLYHCYLFCEAESPEEVGRNIRKREGALALRSNGQHLLDFVRVIDKLRDAVDSCNFIVRQWFSDNLRNDYVLLPVLYYFYKQADVCMDPLNDLQHVDLSRIVRWIALNEVSPSVFRGGALRLARVWPVLHSSMREALQEQLDKYHGTQSAAEREFNLHFPLQRLQQDLEQAFGGKEGTEALLWLSDTEIEKLLDNIRIKHRGCIPLITLLYCHPQRISLMQRYEERQIDFIQPQKLLSKRMLKTYDLSDEQIKLYFDRRDSILNLQWLPRRLQTEKGDIPFRQWLSNSQQLQLLGEQNQFQKKELIINFMRFHHIKTEDGIYTINAFEHFLQERRSLLFRALKQYGQDFSDWDLKAKLPQIDYAAF